jgi:DNA-binding transcriptional LysR family regulator
MTVNLRHLEVFRLLMQTRNVTETSRLLRVSQPATSQTLKDLETSLGLQLFIRNGGRISPTAEARMLLPDAERLLLQLAAIEARADELRDARAGSLSIAAIPAAAGSLLPPALAAFKQTRPRVRLSMNAYESQETVRQVRHEGADLGIVFAPVDDPGVGIEPLLRTRMVCLMSPRHPLAASTVIRARELTAHTVVLLDPATTPGMILREKLTEHRIALGATLQTNLSYGAVSLVRQELGVFITDPVILLSGMADGLTIRPFEPEVTLVLTAIYARQRPVSRVMARFLVELRAVIAELSQRLRRQSVVAEAL